MKLTDRLQALHCHHLMEVISDANARVPIDKRGTFRHHSVRNVIAHFSDQGLLELEAHVASRDVTKIAPFTVAKKYLMNMEITRADPRIIPRTQEKYRALYVEYCKKEFAESVF